MLGCPIRESRDQWSLAPAPGLSQLITPFIACESLGIRRTPLLPFSHTSPPDLRRARVYSRTDPHRNKCGEGSDFPLLLVQHAKERPATARAAPKGDGAALNRTGGRAPEGASPVPAYGNQKTDRQARRSGPRRETGCPCALRIRMSAPALLFLQKGGVPAAPSGTATLLRLSPNHRSRPRPILAATDFRRPRLSWLDGRCVQGPGTYSPRHG